jgi:hypothetical protein
VVLSMILSINENWDVIISLVDLSEAVWARCMKWRVS